MDALSVSLLTTAIAFVIFTIVYAIRIDYDIKHSELSNRSASYKSLYPSTFFDLKDDEIHTLEDKIVGSCAIKSPDYEYYTRDGEKNRISSSKEEVKSIKQQEIIAGYVQKITDLYRNAIKNRNLDLCEKTAILCRKTIAVEKNAFLVDNGDYARNFNFTIQNEITNLVLTGITIPTILSLLHNPDETRNMIDVITSNRALQVYIFTFVVVAAYRILKYYHNKKSMLSCFHVEKGYDKAELLLDCFEAALNEQRNHR